VFLGGWGFKKRGMFLPPGGETLDEEGTHSFLFLNKNFYQLFNKSFIVIDLTIKKCILSILYNFIFNNIRFRGFFTEI
jgi:hypothetical protein